MKRTFQAIFSIYAFAIFILLMLLLLPFVAVAALPGTIRSGNIILKVCRFWADAGLFCWGIRHKNIFEAPKARDHAVVFVFNHTSYLDIPILMKAFRKEQIRILAKASMAKIPIFGYIYKQITVLVDRSSPEARARSVSQMKTLLEKNISIVIAPEGTFNMTSDPLKSFYDGAFKIAINTQVPIQPVLFLDAYDRLNPHSVLSLSWGKSRAVFLEEISVKGLQEKDVEYLKQKTFTFMEKGLIRYNVSWIK